MSSNRRSNRNNQNDQRQDEINALNRLAAVLERLTNPPPVTSNYISVDTLTVLSPSETPSEPRTKEPKRKKSKTNRNYAVTEPTPSANPNYTYTNQQPPKQAHTQINTSKRTRKEYTGSYPLCVNCTFHHSSTTACRLCTQCNRLGHFATNCRVNPLPAITATQTPKTATSRTCYECGDPNHLRHACPKLRIIPAPQPDHNRSITLTTAQDQDRPLNQLTATTVPTPQQDQAPEFYNSVMNFII